MTVQPIQLFAPAQLTGSASVFYTSAGGFYTRIDKLTLTNQDSAPHNVTIYLVPASGSPGPTNLITKAYPIVAGGTWNVPDVVGQILGAGGTLQMFADTTSEVTAFGSGTLISPS